VKIRFNSVLPYFEAAMLENTFLQSELTVYVIKTNLMHYISSVYFVSQPLHVLVIFVAYHQEVYCIYTTTGTGCAHNWYVLCFSVDCLLANRQSTEKHNTCKTFGMCCAKNWYVLCFSVDSLLANRQSNEKHITYKTLVCVVPKISTFCAFQLTLRWPTVN